MTTFYHCPCGALTLTPGPCAACQRREESERLCAEFAAMEARRRKPKSKRRDVPPGNIAVATMLGREDGRRGLPPHGVGRFRGFGGRRAWEAYRRGYEAGST